MGSASGASLVAFGTEAQSAEKKMGKCTLGTQFKKKKKKDSLQSVTVDCNKN